MSPVSPPRPVARRRFDLVVVGGGTIGMSAAWRSAQRGMTVAVVDPAPGRGASWVAAGMLAPVSEVLHGEEALLALALSAARRWPAFAAELSETVGRPVGYRASGTLIVAADDGDRAWARHLHDFQCDLGLEVQWLTGREARTREPALAPGVRAGIWVADDHQVHNRLLVEALHDAAVGTGVSVVRRRVDAVVSAAGSVHGVVLDDGTEIEAEAVVLAAGCWSAAIGGVAAGAVPPVRPVKGQILRLAPSGSAPPLGHTVRGVVGGSSVYLVPRADGSVVVGATVEERGFDTTVTAGAVYELLRDAHRVVPGVSEMVLDEASAGLRPGSPDNGPVVGPVRSAGCDGLVVATGHHRQGILLTPITADAVAAVVAGDDPPEALAPFGPGRFGPGASPRPVAARLGP